MKTRFLSVRVHSETRNNRFRLIREALADEHTDVRGPDGIPKDKIILVGYVSDWTGVVSIASCEFSGQLITDNQYLTVEVQA